MSGDFDVYAFWVCFALGFVRFIRFVFSVINRPSLASVNDLRVWNIQAYALFGNTVGLPAAFLEVVLDSIPKTMGKVKLNSDI